jgi:SAM-dependent methyltransferase
MEAAYAQRYRALWDGHWWWRSREALLLAEIGRICRSTPVREILDVGCGDGLFFDALARFGEVDGLEPDASLLHDARWRDRIAVGRLGAGFRPARTYDLLLMLDVLEHIEDDRAALDSAWELTRPGGVLLLTVPALPWLWSRHDEANAHFRRYRAEGLRRILEGAGFEVQSVRFAFAWTVVPMLLRRWLAPAGRGSADYDVAIPPGPVNALLAAWSKAEHALGRVVRWPIGSSLLAVARRPVECLSGGGHGGPPHPDRTATPRVEPL